MTKEAHPGTSLEETTSMKKRAWASWTGSLGWREELGKRSAMNSTRTRDSAILVDSGDGSSAGALGPPYAIAGTFFLEKVARG